MDLETGHIQVRIIQCLIQQEREVQRVGAQIDDYTIEMRNSSEKLTLRQ
jgi:hypothetical protein